MSDLDRSNRKGALAASVAALLLAGGVQAQAAPMDDMPGMSGKAGAESGKQQTASATGTVAAVNASQH